MRAGARKRISWAAVVVGAATLAVAHVDTAAAQTAADLFDARVVQEVRLFINERDLKELRERYLENVYFPADLHWGGLQVRNVGVRSRGLASRSATKLGLKIDFNHFSTGQRFLGLASLVLDNLVTDPSMVRDSVAMSFFSHLGEPSSRQAFARVYINGVFQGLYALVEVVDDDFLARTIGERDGYLFERHFVAPFLGSDLGDDPAAYRTVFQPRTHELEPDTVLFTPIRNLFREVNQPVDSAWRDRVEQYIDLKQLVTHAAIETFLAERDGVLGESGMANFYLYRSRSSDRHRLIVWDKDSTFSAIDRSIAQGVAENILFSRALTFSDLRALYLDVLERCARLAAADDWLENEIARVTATVTIAAHEDGTKPYTNDAFDAAVDFLTLFARQRSSFVLQEIARERQVR